MVDRHELVFRMPCRSSGSYAEDQPCSCMTSAVEQALAAAPGSILQFLGHSLATPLRETAGDVARMQTAAASCTVLRTLVQRRASLRWNRGRPR